MIEMTRLRRLIRTTLVIAGWGVVNSITNPQPIVYAQTPQEHEDWPSLTDVVQREAGFGKLVSSVSEREEPRGDGTIEQRLIEVSLPINLDSVFVDLAELVLSFDSPTDMTEPVVVAFFPALGEEASVSRPPGGVEDERQFAFDSEFLSVASIPPAGIQGEIRIDITTTVRRWISRQSTNNGLVMTFMTDGGVLPTWIRDGRYNGADARIELHVSRN